MNAINFDYRVHEGARGRAGAAGLVVLFAFVFAIGIVVGVASFPLAPAAPPRRPKAPLPSYDPLSSYSDAAIKPALDFFDCGL